MKHSIILECMSDCDCADKPLLNNQAQIHYNELPNNTSLGTDEVEITQFVKEADKLFDENDTYFDMTQSLEQLSNVLQTTQTSEGMQSAEARVLTNALECILRPLKVQVKPVPALENFSSVVYRKQATQYAMEAVTETLGKMWDALVKFIKKIFESTKNFIKKVFDGNERLKDRIKNLKLKLKKYQSSEPKKKEIDLGSKANTLTYDGKLITAATCTTYADNIVKTVEKLVTRTENSQKYILNLCGSTKEFEKFKSIGSLLNETIILNDKEAKVDAGHEQVADMKRYISEELMGNKALVTTLPDLKGDAKTVQTLSASEYTKKLFDIGVKVTEFNPKQQPLTDDQAKTDIPTGQQMLKGVDTIEKITGLVEKGKKASSDAIKTMDTCLKIVNAQKSTMEDNDKSKDTAKMMKTFASKASSLSSKFVLTTNTLALSCAKQYLDYVDQCLNVYKDKMTDEEKKAEKEKSAQAQPA